MALVNCPDCGREISDAAPHCPGCMRPSRRHEAAPYGRERERILMERLRAYVGDNWESHYHEAFEKLLRGERSFGRAPGWTWNWAAFLFPGWFLYRRLYLGFFAIVAAGVLMGGADAYPPLYLGLCVLQGFVGDRLLFSKARDVVSSAGPGANLAHLSRRGRPLMWVVWANVALACVGPVIMVMIIGWTVFQTAAAEADERRQLLESPIRADGWVSFATPRGKFRAAFPQSPLYSAEAGGNEHRYRAEYLDGGATVTVSFEAERDAAVSLAERFRLVAASPWVRDPVEPVPVALGPHPGMEAAYEVEKDGEDWVVHHRIYDVGPRSYQLVATMRKGGPAQDDAERFFSSFELVEFDP